MFRKNAGASEIKGHPSLPTLVYFTVEFEPRDSSGLPNTTDTQALYDFEEVAIPKIEAEAKCVLVASVVKGGIKDHLFYVSDPDSFLEAMNGERKALENFRGALEQHTDPNWDVYSDFPGGD